MKIILILFGLSLVSFHVNAQEAEVLSEAGVVPEADLDQGLVDQAEETIDLDSADSSSTMNESPMAPDDGSQTTEKAGISDSNTEAPIQSGPLIDLFGPTLLSLEFTDSTTAQFKEHYTNEILRDKKVIGVYFSADWCGPCRKFTPDLIKFYERINNRRGRKDEFQIVWVSRCRDVQSYGQFFAHMPWIALPPQEAMGERGEKLSKLYGVKGIPTLVLLDDFGDVINKDGRNMIPKDKTGIGFPWRNPVASIYMTLVPRSLRFLVKREIGMLRQKALGRIKAILGLGKA